jgi:hypothetical protein
MEILRCKSERHIKSRRRKWAGGVGLVPLDSRYPNISGSDADGKFA